MASARIEFIRLAPGVGSGRAFANTIDAIYSVADIEVTSTVTASASRPTAPAFDSFGAGHARVTAIGAPILVSWGTNPTASATALAIRIEAGTTEVIPVVAGHRLSFILA